MRMISQVAPAVPCIYVEVPLPNVFLRPSNQPPMFSIGTFETIYLENYG